MYKSQLEIIELLLNNPTLREYYEYEAARTKERIDAHTKERKVVPYKRVGREEQLSREEKQLEKLDRAFIRGIIDDTEYVEIRRRLAGKRDA